MSASLSVFATASDAVPSCVRDSTSLCAKVYDVVHSSWLATNADALVATPARILLVVVVAVLARWLVNRGIRRLTESTSTGTVPTVLRPLRSRVAGQRDGDSSPPAGRSGPRPSARCCAASPRS